MKSQCLPYSQIPHTTRLFEDFLSGGPKTQPFYPRNPNFPEWFKDETALVSYEPARRARVAEILERQNKAFGASAKTLENIARLKAGAFAAVTGQQVGLFGGPLFAIFKALTAVKLADHATKQGIETVPVFWLATQDHDLEEIRHTLMPGAEATLRRLETTTSGLTDAPVGSISFGPEIEEAVNVATELLGESEFVTLLRETYKPGETFGSAFAKLFARLFAEWGVILLDASDPELNAVAAPIYRTAIERAAEIESALVERGKELESAGYHQQVKVTSSSTLMFLLQDGARTPIHRKGYEFIVGDKALSKAELLQKIEAAPGDFSANVLLRPVVQDYLLPTVAYTGGTAEVAYFGQAAVVYHAILQRVTPIIPRFSATVIEPKVQALLDRYGLTPQSTFDGPESVRGHIAEQTLPKELQAAFDAAENSLQKSFTGINEALTRLDKTLVDAAGNAQSKMGHQLEGLRAKAARAEMRQSEVLDRHAQLLSNALYPNKSLQERELAGIYFVARYGSAFLQDVYDSMHADCFDHQLLSV